MVSPPRSQLSPRLVTPLATLLHLMHIIQYTDALCDCRTVSTIQKATGVKDVHLVTMVTHVLALNLTAGDACVL